MSSQRFVLRLGQDLRLNKELVLSPLGKALTKHLTCHYLLMDQADCDPTASLHKLAAVISWPRLIYRLQKDK